ncbi:hypothetical protein NKH18_17950 [Streptomyces sp. M10(2022)]
MHLIHPLPCGAQWLAGGGVSVDHFEEADILTRRHLMDVLGPPGRPST